MTSNLASINEVSGPITHASERRAPPRLLVVSANAYVENSPRGVRTRALLEGFASDWEVYVIGRAHPEEPVSYRVPSGLRRVLGQSLKTILIDRFEPWSRTHVRRLPPVDAAYLLGFPFSPIAYASAALIRSGTPYVVDLGDPWALTATVPAVRGMALLRARRAEADVWRNATAAVLTTLTQAEALAQHYPSLPILVRPNGIRPTGGASQTMPGRVSESVLRLVHFGNIYEARLPIAALIDQLAQSQLWNRVEFHQYGTTVGRAVKGVRHARVESHAPIAWSDATSLSASFSAAVVIGNVDHKQLPSKAIDYLALPVPRIAVTSPHERDALREYVRDKPAWLCLSPDQRNAAELVLAHVTRQWTEPDFQAPPSESWDGVSARVGRFLQEQLSQEGQC
jgi:hypothetical protein